MPITGTKYMMIPFFWILNIYQESFTFI